MTVWKRRDFATEPVRPNITGGLGEPVMRRFPARSLFSCVAMVALLATACSRDPKPGTPEAAAVGERFMRQMSDTLKNAPALSFATNEALDGVRQSAPRTSPGG